MKTFTKTTEYVTQTRTEEKTFKNLSDWQGNIFESSSFSGFLAQ